jgi:uracil-DNA glycosylase family 4
MAFWADAGVDVAYADAPQDRLTPPPARNPATESRTPKAQAPHGAPKPTGEVADAFLEAKHLAEAALDLAALEAAITAFNGCPLKTQGAARAVFARGDPAAPVMVVGEGPGADEDRLGEPFVGRAGKLLDKMLAAAGLTDRVFITNTVFWRPPGNRTPTPSEQAVCRPFVERAIALVQPKVLVLAGGASAKAMLGSSDGILKLRGLWFDWKSEDGQIALPALPILHPAFLLRQPLAKKQAWADLLSLVARLETLG